MEFITVKRVVSKGVSKDWQYHNYIVYDTKFNAYDLIDKPWCPWRPVGKDESWLLPSETKCGKHFTLTPDCVFI